MSRTSRGVAARVAARRAKRRRRMAVAVAVVLVVAAAVLFASLYRNGPTAGAGTGHLGPEGMPLEVGTPLVPAASPAGGAPVDGVSCDTDEQVAYHIHVHLAVYVDGVPRAIPAGIGIVEPAVTRTDQGPFVEATRCYYWLHTHVADGVIHIESPTEARYTLGDFFDIWGQPLAADRVGPATGAVTAYVNGAPYTGDPRGIALSERDDIQLDVGTPVVSPQPVDWAASQL